MVCPYNKCARAGGHSPACWPKTFSRLQLRRCASSHSANPFMLQPENNRLRVFARCRIPELVAREPPLFFFPAIACILCSPGRFGFFLRSPAASRELICFAYR